MQPIHPEGGESEALLSVVYASTSTVDFSEVDLALLLAVSRSNNEARGLTGRLLYRDQQFMQALEGPAPAVRRLLGIIAADHRHSGVWILDERRVAARRFGSWAMGYRSPAPEGEPDWFGSPEALRGRSRSRAEELLAWFQQG